MNKFIIDKEKCTGCGLCHRACPGMLLFKGADGKTDTRPVKELSWAGCWKCQHCMAVCPNGAISVMGKSPENSLPIYSSDMGEDFAKLLKDRKLTEEFIDASKKPLSEGDLDHILKVLVNAPTGGNKMMVEYTVLSDPGKSQRIGELVGVRAPYYFIAHVPGKYGNTAEEIKAGKNSTPVIPEEDDVDNSIALGYFEILSNAHGLGTNPVNLPKDQAKKEEIYEILNIPKEHIVLRIIGFGYAKNPIVLPGGFAEKVDRLVAGRASCRHFKQENVDDSLKTKLYDTLRAANEASGKTHVEFNIFDDINKVNEIRNALVEGYKRMKSQGILPYSWNEERIKIMEDRGDLAMNGDMFFCSAPHLFVPHMSKEYATAAVDTSLNLTYFELLAQSFGLGAIYLGFSINVMRMLPEVYELLEIPKNHFMVNVMGFGYPDFSYARGTQKDGFVIIHRV